MIDALDLPATEEFIGRAVHGAADEFAAADGEFPDSAGDEAMGTVLVADDIFGLGVSR